jgi:hypothetical protein
VKDLKEKTDGFQDCRYAVFDFKFQTHRPGAGTSKMDKIVFIQVFFFSHFNNQIPTGISSCVQMAHRSRRRCFMPRQHPQ